MAERVEVYITRVIHDGAQAFGVRTDNDEAVYLPRSVCQDVQPYEGDKVRVIVTRNRDPIKGKDVPWFAQQGENLEDED